MSLRIIGGRFKNHQLKTPSTTLTKPTMSMMRKSLFDIVQMEIDGARFLDVFACSGAVGLEAISRGAASATFIDKDRKAVRCIEENIDKLNVRPLCTVICSDALTALKTLAKQKASFSLVFLDPPYIHAMRSECSPRELLLFFDTSEILEMGGKLFIEESAESTFDPSTIELSRLIFKNSRKFSGSLLHQFERIH
jgi:16S rRNA (guanine966-N2)-methyltransferase